MDFTKQVGKHLELYVSTWKDPRNKEQTGFSAKFEKFDDLLHDIRTEDEKRRDEIEDENFSWGLGSSLNLEPRYASMRIFKIVGESPHPLVKGELWDVEVVWCQHNPREPLTGGYQRKIRFGVKPLQRLERILERCDLEKGTIYREKICGISRKVEEVPCDVRRARYRVGDQIVDLRVAFLGDKMQPYCKVSAWESIRLLEERQHRALGSAFSAQRFAKEVGLPAPPEMLRELLTRS